MKKINISYNYISKNFTNNSEEISSWDDARYTILLQGHILLNNNKDNLQQIADCFSVYECEITKKLEGLYIIVIFDKNNQKLIVFQDRTTSPVTVYYTIVNDTIFVSTSLKTLLEDSKTERKLNESVIDEFIANGFIYGKETLVDQVYKIAPYHSLIVEGDNIEQKKVFYSTSNLTRGQALDSFKSTLDKAIVDSVENFTEIGLPLSSGFDSNYIAHILSSCTDKQLNAFSVGGKTGRNEISAVEKNIHYYSRTNLNIAMTTPDTFSHFSEIVERLEGSVFDVGIFLQYELMKKVSECGNTNLICGECADQVFNPLYYEKTQIFPEKNGTKKYEFSQYPYIVGTQKILKKSGIMANSFDIETFYPYLNDNVVNNAEALDWLGDKYRGCHVRNCHECLPLDLFKNIKKLGGATHFISLFNSKKEMKAFFKNIESSEFYQNHKKNIKRCRNLEKENPSKRVAIKASIRNIVLSVLHIDIEARRKNRLLLTEKKLGEYLCIAYLIEFENLMKNLFTTHHE